MRKVLAFFLLLIVCSLLSACNNQSGQIAVLSSNTLQPSVTIVPTLTITITQTLPEPTGTKTPSLTVKPSLTATELTPTPTVTLIPPHPTKQVLLDYFGSGYHSDLNSFLGSRNSSMLVLYTDRQIIIHRDNTYSQKIFSQDEVNQFFSQLEELGLFVIESNQTHDPTDRLYDFGGDFERVDDGYQYCVQANGDQARNLCVYKPYMQYLVPQMQQILKFLDEYQPVGMVPYHPDRILILVENGRSAYAADLPQEAIPWAESSLSLEISCSKLYCSKVLYAEGELANKLYMLYGDRRYLFTQNGLEYTVAIRVVLPHEEVTNIYEQ